MTSLIRRIRAGWITLTGTGATASIVLAVLTVACVFVAVAGPRQSRQDGTARCRQADAARGRGGACGQR